MKTIEIDGKAYMVVPAIQFGSCEHCAFQTNTISRTSKRYNELSEKCRHAKALHSCHNPDDVTGDFVFIKVGNKRRLALYLAERMTA